MILYGLQKRGQQSRRPTPLPRGMRLRHGILPTQSSSLRELCGYLHYPLKRQVDFEVEN